MDRDLSLLKQFLHKKIKNIETNDFSTQDFIRLRNYFLQDLASTTDNREEDLKKYLFLGFFIFHNKNFIINESN